MVGDIYITIDGVTEQLSVQQFDGMRVIRHNEPSATIEHNSTVAHQDNKTGVSRSLCRLDENFVNSQSVVEQASAYIVLTYTSVAGKARALELGKAITTFLTANNYQQLVSIAAKGYGVTVTP